MAGIILRPPVLIDTPAPSMVACTDAREFLSARRADICYLDPPYAVHQYGSNYFMLNSIALWDKPPVSAARGPDGRLRSKAGIRPDWTRTRSEFCYPSTAFDAMRGIVQAADCRWLVVSYSDEGLIGLEELCELLAGTGSLSIRSTGYVKYPGGKQSLDRTTRNQELALVVDRTGIARARGAQRTRPVSELLFDVRIARLMGQAFDPVRIRRAFCVEKDAIVVEPSPGKTARLPMRHCWRFTTDAVPPRFGTSADAERFVADLRGCLVHDVREEIDVIVGITRGEREAREKDKLLKEILRLANKLAHRKYADVCAKALEGLRAFASGDPALTEFRDGLDRIALTAAKRRATE
jgi:adenine-specific DNA-methyltransferase